MDQGHDPRIVRSAELEIDPVQLDAYNALLSEEVEVSVRLEPGALTDAPEKIRLLEVYADEEAYQTISPRRISADTRRSRPSWSVRSASCL